MMRNVCCSKGGQVGSTVRIALLSHSWGPESVILALFPKGFTVSQNSTMSPDHRRACCQLLTDITFAGDSWADTWHPRDPSMGNRHRHHQLQEKHWEVRVPPFVPFPGIAIIMITTVYVCTELCQTESLSPYLFTITYKLGKLFPLGRQNRKWMFPEVKWMVPGHTAACVKAHIFLCWNFMVFPAYRTASWPMNHTSP